MKSFLPILLVALLLPLEASAFTPPKVGKQYLTIGLSLQPGFLSDSVERENPTPAFAQGTMLRLGLHHVVASQLYMGFEVEAGSQYMNEHTASADGAAPSSSSFAWQLAFLARWVPAGDDGGFHVGGGLQWFNLSFGDEGIQVLGLDVRSGWYLWRRDDFALFEVGYVVPFISGLDLPTDFTGDSEPPITKTWTLHRFMISFNYGW